ncbi:hypothetical protein [uncultured Actinobacillus sp.]|uniref:hypothetical protein n=1 Tax=uncultured Actinobacillus sp. TaxID=417616 RepID=UPI0025ECAD82|nr:hypothetical protein [uncultured Actinobacillus sp.]
MEIIAQYELNEPLDDKTLRQQLKSLGVDARRLSRFTQLALLSALSLREHLTQESRFYLGASFNSPSKFFKMFNNLMQENIPSPLDFMANINNAATFQIAQSLNLQGATVFLALEKENVAQLFQLAELDLNAGETALIGWVCEHLEGNLPDQSIWWVVRV